MAQRQTGPRRGRWRQYGTLLVLSLLAAAVLGYWAVSERTAGQRKEGEAVPLIADASLPGAGRRVLDELTVEQRGPAGGRSEFSLQRRPDGFYLTPPGHRADDAAAESLLSALVSAVVEHRVTTEGGTTPPAGPFGVAPEQCRMRVRWGTGPGLCFGTETLAGSVYVRREDSPEILVVDGALFALLARPPEQYRAHKVVLVPLQTAHKIELGALRIARDGGLWRVQQDAGPWALAEPAAVEELLARLLAWPVVAWSAPRPELATTPPPVRLSVDGQELLRGGWPSPQGGPRTQLFVRSDGEWLSAADPQSQRLLPRWEDLRAQRLVPVSSAEVALLQVAPHVSAARQPDGTYLHAGRPAETASVLRCLQLLTRTGISAEAVAARPPKDALRITVSTTLGQVVTVRLWRVGADTFAQRDEEPPARVLDSVAELFATNPLSVAPLRLASLHPAAVRRIERQRPGQAPEVLVRAGAWQIHAPAEAPVDSAAMAKLLAGFTDLRAVRWAAEQPRPEHGLATPRLTLTITTRTQEAAPERSFRLAVGAPASDYGDCYAQRSGGAVAVLDAATCAALTQPLVSPWLLRIDDARLISVELRQGEAPAVSCAQRGSQWSCGDHALSPQAQRLLLSALHGLARGESPTYGAAPAMPPRLTLRVVHQPPPHPEQQAGEEVAPTEQTLRLYDASTSVWLAQLAQRALTYQVPAAAATALAAALGSAR